MTIRAKVWILVAASCGGYRRSNAVGSHIRDAPRADPAGTGICRRDRGRHQAGLERFDADAEERDYAIALSNYINRHPRIQRLQLVFEPDVLSAPSVRIVAPRGEATEITRLPPFRANPIVYFAQGDRGRCLHPRSASSISKVLGRATCSCTGVWVRWRTDHQSHRALVADPRDSPARGRWSLLIGFLINRIVLRRLESLALAMRDVEGGNLNRRVTPGAPDEVGRLSLGFNQMLDQLSNATREIREFNQRLGQEIHLATQDLSRKNVALGQLNRLLNDLRRENASKVRLATLDSLPPS